MSKGKQPRSTSKDPKRVLSGKGCGVALTARRLAQKQPSLKECVTAHWSSVPAPKMWGAKHGAEASDSVEISIDW